MHIQNFKTFCDLVETKSFSKAARLNEVTQSAVSQQLKAMEAHYDMLIIDRNQKKFRLTPQGTALYSTFKEILSLYDKLHCEIQEMLNIVSGTIQISTVNSIGLHELPPYLKQFIKEFPSVNARVEYRRANLVYEDVLHGTADLGLVAFPSPHKELEIESFANDELIVAMSPENKLANKKILAIENLNGMDLVAFEKDIPTRKRRMKFFQMREWKLRSLWSLTMLRPSREHWRLMQVWPFYLLVQLEMKSKEISLSPLSFKAEFTIVHLR